MTVGVRSFFAKTSTRQHPLPVTGTLFSVYRLGITVRDEETESIHRWVEPHVAWQMEISDIAQEETAASPVLLDEAAAVCSEQ
jgi:hypothetical protein